jgi:UDP-N-acetylglucosamine 1-carboxyvinyltransferase
MLKDKFLIKGLAGKRKLKGEISISGAKNAVLKIMAASILFSDDLIIENVPKVDDVLKMTELLEGLGAKVLKVGENKLKINTKDIDNTVLNKEAAKKIRASITLIGPILARFGKVSFPHPGGDVIVAGGRPIGLFLNGLKGMGVEETRSKNGIYNLKIKSKLKGKPIFFNKISVTATETFLMAAVLAKGKTVLKNVALEPEIISLGEFLISCGAKIRGLGTTHIEIEGGKLLKARGKKYKVIPDRIEAGSYLLLGALASNDLTIKNCHPEHMESLTSVLRFSGLKMKTGKNYIKILDNSKTKFKAIQIKTHEYPGFVTDIQAPMTVFLTQTHGESSIFETIFENRLGFSKDLNKMGAKIKIWHPQKISIKGPTPLYGAKVKGPDLRAGLAFIMASIIAKGDSIVENAYHIDRGYEKVEEKLSSIGVGIKRIKN